MKTITLMTGADFDLLISQIKRIGKLTNSMIQRAAVFAVYQSIEHRNSTPADTLYQAMPSGTRRNALVAFFEANGNLAFAEKKVVFFDVEDMTGTPVAEFNEKALLATEWHTFAKEPDITSAWDVKEKVEKVLAQLDRAVKNQEREVMHKELITKLREVLAAGAASE